MHLKNKTQSGWLNLSILAFAIGGIYSILLVLLRTPYINEKIPFMNFFRTSLVVHVDLTVLFWLLSVFAIILSFVTKKTYSFFDDISLKIAFISCITIAISPFTVIDSKPLMNNYVPMLQNFSFCLGLGLFASALIIKIIIALMSINFKKFEDLDTVFTVSSSFIAIIGFICFTMSYMGIMNENFQIAKNIETFYEILFWGFGHVMQFLFANLMIYAQVRLSENIFKIEYNLTTLKIIFYFNLFAVFPAIIPYMYYNVTGGDYILFFTNHMRYFGAIAPSLMLIAMIYKLWDSFEWKKSLTFSCFIMSIVLFNTGGLISLFIKGVNVVIPAHYHGSIVGITIALMGLIYYFIEDEKRPKLFLSQSYIYGIGQMMHIIGLAISGGYGELRKTPGAMQSSKAVAAMGLMGLGGLIAVIGGLLFVINCYKILSKKNA